MDAMNQTDTKLILKINEAADEVSIGMFTQLELLKERKGFLSNEIKRLEKELEKVKQECSSNDKKIEFVDKKLEEERRTHMYARIERKDEELKATSPPYVPECANACAECVGPLERRFACDHFQCFKDSEKCWHCGETRSRKRLKMEYIPAPEKKYVFLFRSPFENHYLQKCESLLHTNSRLLFIIFVQAAQRSFSEQFQKARSKGCLSRH